MLFSLLKLLLKHKTNENRYFCYRVNLITGKENVVQDLSDIATFFSTSRWRLCPEGDKLISALSDSNTESYLFKSMWRSGEMPSR